MAAVNAMMSVLNAGDEIVAANQVKFEHNKNIGFIQLTFRTFSHYI